MLLSLRRAVLFLFIANLSTASILDSRQTSPITQDLALVAQDTCNCSSLVYAWNGSPNTWQPIQDCLTQLYLDLKKTVNDANNSPVITSTQCQELISVMTGKVEPCFKKLCQSFLDRKKDITNANLFNLVKQDISDIISYYKAMIAAVQPKLPSDCQNSWNNVIGLMVNEWTAVSNAYNS